MRGILQRNAPDLIRESEEVTFKLRLENKQELVKLKRNRKEFLCGENTMGKDSELRENRDVKKLKTLVW